MITEERLLNLVRFVINDQYIMEKYPDSKANPAKVDKDTKDFLEFLENAKDNKDTIATVADWVTSHFDMNDFDTIMDDRLYAVIADGLDEHYMDYLGYDSSVVAHEYEKKYANADFER